MNGILQNVFAMQNYFFIFYVGKNHGNNSTLILFRQFKSRVNMAWTVIYKVCQKNTVLD